MSQKLQLLKVDWNKLLLQVSWFAVIYSNLKVYCVLFVISGGYRAVKLGQLSVIVLKFKEDIIEPYEGVVRNEFCVHGRSSLNYFKLLKHQF
jgi:hypothetical protein